MENLSIQQVHQITHVMCFWQAGKQWCRQANAQQGLGGAMVSIARSVEGRHIIGYGVIGQKP
jgi:hypothetical protein